MSPRVGLSCLVVLLLPAFVRAEGVRPEQLLAAETMFYLRHDGIDTHRKAYDQSALAETLRGELGDFVDYLTNLTRDSIGPSLLKEQVLEGKPAARLQPLRNGFRHAPDALHCLGKHGFVVGVEIVGLIPPRVQVTVVFPNGADDKHRAATMAGLRLFAALADVPIVENKVAGRTFYQWKQPEPEIVKVAFWQEGKHLVLSIGSEKPERTLEFLEGKRKNILQNPLFKEVEGFKDYETVARGFIELEKYLKPLHLLPPPADQLLTRFGVDNLKSATVYVGFEGRAMRTTLALRVPGKRTGLLGVLAGGEPVDPERLPPLPPDMTSLYVFNLDAGDLFDLVVGAMEAVASVSSDEERKQVQDGVKGLNDRLGVDVRKDLLGSLGSRLILYNAPSEGPMSLGFGAVFEVKDEAKFKASLETALKSLPLLLGDNVTVRKKSCAGGELHSMHVAQEGFVFAPSFALHKGRLVIGLYPQTVRGFLLRSSGKVATWKPTPLVADAFAAAKKSKARVVGMTVSDPRPTLKQLCSIGPFIGGLADSSSPGSFDVSRIPNGQAVTEPLFPNVALLLDDGDLIRLDSRDSLAVPLFDLSGMDAYMSALVGYQLLRLGAN